jgi:hypothetical protein
VLNWVGMGADVDAAAGRHDDQRVPAGQHVVDDRLLLPAKAAVPEHTEKNVGRGHAAHRKMLTACANVPCR